MLLPRTCRRTMPGSTRAPGRRTGQGAHVAPGYRTVPPQMPLRRAESQSETISAPGQCRTLERGSEALRMAYSA